MANEVDYLPVSYKGNGSTKDFPFDWKIFSDTDIIVKIINQNNEEILLELKNDYDVSFGSIGGNISFKIAPEDGTNILISREISNYQPKEYSTSVGFQGSEIETSFDKTSCCLQDMDYKIKQFKENFTDEINEKIDIYKEDTNNQIEELESLIDSNKEEINQDFQEFTNQINSTIDKVNQAAEVIDTTIASVNESVETCSDKANIATEQANKAEEQFRLATKQAELAKEKAEEAKLIVENKANVDLDNLSEAGLKVIEKNSGSGLEICDIGMTLYIDESKGLRRWLNGQVVAMNANTQAFLNRLKHAGIFKPVKTNQSSIS